MKKRSSGLWVLPRWVQLGLVSLPAVAAYAILVRLYTSIPILDDYEMLFVFALAFAKAGTLAGKFGLLFTTQVGPYKLIFEHLLVGLQILWFRRMSFPAMIWAGNLMPLLISLLLWKHVEENRPPARNRVLVMLPVMLLLFCLNWAETLNFAVSGLQEQVVVLFSFAALHFLVKRGDQAGALAAACLFGVAATTAFPNGILVWPVGLAFLAMEDRNWVKFAAWGAGFAVCLGAYAYRFQPVTIASKGTLAAKALFAAMFCGSAMENMHHRPVPYISVAIGLAVAAVFGHAVRTRFDRRNPFFFYAAVWMLATAAVVANGRAGAGLQQSLSSRYKIYCDLLLVFCYVYLLDRWHRRGDATAVRRFVGWSIAVGLMVGIGGDLAGAKALAVRKGRAERAWQGYLADPDRASPMFLVEETLSPGEIALEEKARVELNEAIRLGIYAPPRF